MRILQLCKKFPYPLRDGESIAVTYLSRALVAQGCEVTLLSMNTTKHRFNIKDIPDDFDHYHSIYTTDLDNTIKAKDAFLNLFTSDSYHIQRYVCSDFNKKLIELLKNNEYDVVQLETLYLTPYIETIKQYSSAIVTMRSHNIEYEIWERITKNTSFLPKKLYLKYLTKKLKSYEIETLNSYDYLIAVSDRDLMRFKKLGYKNGAMASPIGLQLDNYTVAKEEADERSLCFIGSLDWIPNLEGLEWFLTKVWPTFNKKRPNYKLKIAGRNTPEHLLNSNYPNVEFLGEVPSAIEFINEHHAMIVPLLSGSGTRVKILEGMALAKPIITTTIGLEGIEAVHEKHLLLADNPREFVGALIKVMDDKKLANELGIEAREFVKKYYDHEAIAKTLIEKYTYLIANPYG